jgi:general stress protein 26
MPHGSSPDDHRKLDRLIRGVKFAMLTTRDAGNALTSRPLTTLDLEFDGTLWFLVAADSNLAHDLRQHPEINLAYAEPEVGNYISVSGTAHVLHDRVRARELWTPVARIWFEQGPDDPNLAVLEVEVEKAEYWDMAGGKVRRLIGFLRATLAHDASGLGGQRR